MLLELIIGFFFGVVGFLISLIPDLSAISIPDTFISAISGFMDFLAYGFVVFPSELFVFLIGNVSFWLGIQIPNAVIEWLYNKIPGVN